MRKVSIADVAAAAGAGTATVDRVLNRRGGVSPRMQERILAAARKLGIDRVLATPEDPWINLGFLMQSPQVPFYAHLANLVQSAEPMFENYRLSCSLYHYASLREHDVVSAIRQASRTADALIVVAQDQPGIRHALGRCSVAGLPIVTLITDVPLSGRIDFVGPDNYRAGRVAGELMGRMLGPAGGDILLVTGLAGLRAIESRAQGFCDVLASRFTRAQIALRIPSEEDPALLGVRVREALEERTSIRGIYNTSVGDEGIGEVLRRTGRAERVTFIAHDLNAASRELLLAGVIDAVIEQDSYAQVLQAVRRVQTHLGRHTVFPVWPDYGIRAVFRESLP